MFLYHLTGQILLIYYFPRVGKLKKYDVKYSIFGFILYSMFVHPESMRRRPLTAFL